MTNNFQRVPLGLWKYNYHQDIFVNPIFLFQWQESVYIKRRSTKTVGEDIQGVYNRCQSPVTKKRKKEKQQKGTPK